MTIRVPVFPTVHVELNADGSADVDVPGDGRTTYPPAHIDSTRTAIIDYVATVAQSLGRPVRMSITEPDGSWFVAVTPTADVDEIELATPKGTGLRLPPRATAVRESSRPQESPELQTTVIQFDPEWAPPAALPAPPVLEADDEDLDETIFIPRPPRVAVQLAFSTGEVATINRKAIIGRRPTGEPGELADLIRLGDNTGTVSRTHCVVTLEDGRCWVVDQHSANGTIITGAKGTSGLLEPGARRELEDGVTVHIGDHQFTVTITSS